MSREELLWYHGKLSRSAAELLIKECVGGGGTDGVFLVRESSSAAGDYVLTLICGQEVCHYQIRRHGEDAFFSIDDKVKILHGLETLVFFYQQAANGLVCKLTTFIKKDPPPNDSRSHGMTNLLHRATKENNQTVVSELLKCGYRNLDAKNEDGQTAVHLAALHCDEAILTLLLEAGVNVNCMDTLGYMPLHYACRSKSSGLIRILIAAHANVQGRNIKNGYVPLHEAAQCGNLDAVKELLAAFAPLLPRSSLGEFPIDLAREAEQEEVVAYLIAYKPPPATTHQSHWFHGTLKREEAVEALMLFGASMEKEHQLKANADSNADALKASAEGLSTDDEIDTSGCFLVRYSERKSPGSGYVLTMLCNKADKHFIISQSSSYLYIDEGPYLPSLEHLVDHFTRFSDGLPVCLKYPVKPKPKPPLPLFSTMPSSHKKVANAITDPPKDNRPQKLALGERKSSGAKHSHTLTSPKSKNKENSTSMFTQRLMDTLRKSKIKNKPPAEAAAPSAGSPEKTPSKLNELEQSETLFKNLSFSTEFSNLHAASTPGAGAEAAAATATVTASLDCFYNVPTNNSPIQIAMSPSEGEAFPIEMEEKTEAEVAYFTQSDAAIAREATHNCPAKFAPVANGYIPTVDIRVFLDQNPLAAYEALELSAVELRAFSDHPDRLDTIISNVSNESDILRYLNRQNSTASTGTLTPPTPQALVNYFIPRDCLELGSIIGEGEFGSVYRGTLIKQNSDGAGVAAVRREVAVKTLHEVQNISNKQALLREASVMIRLQHDCIVQFVGIAKIDSLLMVQELVALGSMLDYIRLHKHKISPNYELKLWSSQIACGMQYLESHHFVHRDLAARNILLASPTQAKISDFGLSRAVGASNACYQATHNGFWPVKWYAPECLKSYIFSHASDVWSFGVTMWEMFTLGEAPFSELNGVDNILKHLERDERLPRPSNCPNNVYRIMQSCWIHNPRDRPTFRYLTEFFASDLDYQKPVASEPGQIVNIS